MPTIRVADLNVQLLLTPGTYFREVEDDLGLIQETFRRAIRVEGISVELLVEYIPPPPPGGDQVTNAILFGESILPFLEIGARKVVDDHLNFDQNARVFGFDNVGDGLSFVELIEFIGPRYGSTTQALNLQQGITAFIGVPWGPVLVEQAIDFFEKASSLAPILVAQEITFVDSALRMTIAEDFLLFVQTIKAGKGSTLLQNLGIEDSWETNNDYQRPLSQDLGIHQFVAYFIESRCGRKTNNRFDGVGGIAPQPKRIKYESKLILDYDEQTVSLRNPESDDRARFSFQRINRETLGGVPDIYADPDWDQSTTLLFTVVAIKAELLESLQTFLSSTVGEEITLHDWEGVNWLGVVTTPNESAVEDGEGYWTLAFEFVGVREPGEVPKNFLNLDHVLGKQVDYTRTVEQSLSLTENPHVAGPIIVTVSQVIPFQSGS